MQNNIVEQLQQAAKARPMRIVLCEAEDARMVQAGLRAAVDGLAHIIFVGETGKFQKLAEDYQANDAINAITHHDPQQSEYRAQFTDDIYALRQHKGITRDGAEQMATSNLGFAAMLVRNNLADGTIGGAVATTADTVRTALQLIGKAETAKIVSSFFIMHLPIQQKYVGFADCGLVVEPNEQELAEIAINTAQSYQALTGNQPKIAMLSFSTLGSASHPEAQKMASAVAIVRQQYPDIIIDGEVQFDAAIDAAIAAKKMQNSPLSGDANIFIFPNLNAGNIGYKIAQYVGGAVAIGPILQGLAKPANDLSRGCSADDIYQMIAVTAVQAQQYNKK